MGNNKQDKKEKTVADIGGIEMAKYQQVNKLFEEEKFHARQGHGFAAERANNLHDRLRGQDAHIVGDDNVKNGPDRRIGDVYIQSKYHASGRSCINDCFDKNGEFRYMYNGKPQQIEVPSDQWDVAVEAMRERILNNEVKGVTDPNEAQNIVRKGNYTYKQARNIAKAGNVDSLKYDAASGAVIAASAFGVTTIITFATNMWNGEGFENSIKRASFSGIKVGGNALVTAILSSQLSKAGLNSALVGSSEAVVQFMGPKASAVLINAFRSGSNIYGAAAMKSAAKLLRGNAIVAGVSVVLLSSADIANIFRGRISGKQLFKNLANTAGTVAGGTGGWLGGAAVGSMILPGAGTLIGGFVGSIMAGTVSSKATNAVLDNFIEDDADEMIQIIQSVFEELASEYLLNEREAKSIIDQLGKRLDGKMLKEMFAQKNRRKYARNLLTPLIEDEVKKRARIRDITDEELIKGLKAALEEIADNNDSDYGSLALI